MVKYLVKTNISLIPNLIRDTVQTVGYKIENDQSDLEDYIDPKLEKINATLNKISRKQLTNSANPIIIYSNYRKLFNKTLEKYYKEQVCLKYIDIYTFFFLYLCHKNYSSSNVVTILKKFIMH